MARVASVPSNHVYVRHLSPPDGRGRVVRLPDPVSDGRAAGAPWWPPRVLDPAWVEDHADDVDLVHVHFGFDAESPEALASWVETLRAHGKPLVLTVHDLRNPHHEDAALHDAQLGVLVGAADALVTLTPGAAREIAARWGRDALVLPHPHVVPVDRLARPRPVHEGFVVGVHCKSLRAGMDPGPVVETAARTLARLAGARLRVDVHTDVMARDGAHHDPRLARTLEGLADDGLLDLHVHDYFSDDELFDYLSGLDVSVLPYRFGTHSGWLEACHDLGTTVLAPDCGHYAEQRPCLVYTPGDPASLTTALESAHAERFAWRARATDRLEERHRLAAAHEELYAAVLARVRRPLEASCTS